MIKEKNCLIFVSTGVIFSEFDSIQMFIVTNQSLRIMSCLVWFYFLVIFDVIIVLFLMHIVQVIDIEKTTQKNLLGILTVFIILNS